MKNKKSEKVVFRLTPRDRRSLERIAELERRSMSDVLRLLISEGGRRRGVVPVQVREPDR